MDILLIGGGFVNKGGEAMSLTVKDELGLRLPGANFLMETLGYRLPEEYFSAARSEDIIPTPPDHSPVLNRLSALALQIARNPRRAEYLGRRRNAFWRTRDLVRQADAFVDVSGYAYADEWGPSKARDMAFTIREAQKQEKPYIVMPQTWGPFTDDELRQSSIYACEHAAAFYARDQQSRRHLADMLEREAASIPRSADLAFAFEPSDESEANELLRSKGLAPGEHPIMAVAPNMRVFERNSGIGSNNDYAKVLIEVCRSCLDRGIDILLVPHEIKPSIGSISDDRLICNIIETALRSHEGAHLVSQEEVLSARLTKALVGSCDMILGSRFHSLVAALSQAVPSVAIGWSFKYQRLMGDFGLEQFVVDYQEMETSGVIDLIKRAWDEREAQKRKIEKRLPKIKAEVRETFDEVANVLRPETIA